MEQIWWVFVAVGVTCSLIGGPIARNRDAFVGGALMGAGIAFCLVGALATFWGVFD